MDYYCGPIRFASVEQARTAWVGSPRSNHSLGGGGLGDSDGVFDIIRVDPDGPARWISPP